MKSQCVPGARRLRRGRAQARRFCTLEAAEEALEEPFVKDFDITGRWAMVAAGGSEDDDELKSWVPPAIGFVSALPAK